MLCESCKNTFYKTGIGLLLLTAFVSVTVGAVAARRGQRAVRAAAAAAHHVRHPVAPLARLVHATPRHAPAKPKQQSRPTPPKEQHDIQPAVRATISLYEHTADASILSQQGCSAAQRGVGGIVILDFGQPAYNGHTYGANLFSGAFAGNKEITAGMLGYAQGYEHCLAPGSKLSITLARGTSNYHPQVPSPYNAGRRWARETHTLAVLLEKSGLAKHVASAAADDVEPAWDRTFHRTRDFFRGYRDANMGHLIYNFGSLDGGVAHGIWNASQIFFVASGMRYARVIPEIYNHAMAREWAYLAHIAQRRYHRPVQFAGVMTTHTSANHGMRPTEAHKSLVRALASYGQAPAVVPPTATNIRAAY
jgi:hypothetical protein